MCASVSGYSMTPSHPPIADATAGQTTPKTRSVLSRRAFLGASLAAATRVIGEAGAGSEDRPASAVPGSALARESAAFLTLDEASAQLRLGKVSPVELTQACLSRIERLNPQLNAFITVCAESALVEARRAEAEIQQGRWHGPLHGIPIALKDLVDTAGVRTTAGSGLFEDRIPVEDAEIVRRLRAAGAVFLGKLNMHEFAYGGSSVISYFGPVRNPWNLAHCSGGSSGGSAVAVAAHLCFGAIGSDTGGSVREPASYCGIVGLKPSYGRVSTAGTVPLSWSLDHLGPMTRTVSDAALMLQAIAGYDPQDTASTDTPVSDYTASLRSSISSLRLGVPQDYFYEGLDPDIHSAMQTALSVFKTLGAHPINIPPLAADATYASVMDPCIAVLQAEAYTFHQDQVANHPERYQKQTLERILAGNKVTIPTYVRSLRQLQHLRRSVARRIEGVDLLVTPTTPVPPYTIADLQSDPAAERPKEVRMLRNTRPFNILGMPTISVPCGFTQSGLPIGMQLTGTLGDEAAILSLAHAYERATHWHQRRPRVEAAVAHPVPSALRSVWL
jgi:aspartyl-tRNA(Asn)/glutamyl-tRNA(Gln) amidotransferase subunit A